MRVERQWEYSLDQSGSVGIRKFRLLVSGLHSGTFYVRDGAGAKHAGDMYRVYKFPAYPTLSLVLLLYFTEIQLHCSHLCFQLPRDFII